MMGHRVRRPSIKAEEAARDAACQSLEVILAAETCAAVLAPLHRQTGRQQTRQKPDELLAHLTNETVCHRVPPAGAPQPTQPPAAGAEEKLEPFSCMQSPSDAAAATAPVTQDVMPQHTSPRMVEREGLFDLGGLPLDLLEGVVAQLPAEELLRVSLVSGSLARAAEAAFRAVCISNGWRFPRRPRGQDASQSIYPWRMLYRCGPASNALIS